MGHVSYFSSEFMEFMRRVQTSVSDFASISDAVRAALPGIADEFDIGRVEIETREIGHADRKKDDSYDVILLYKWRGKISDESVSKSFCSRKSDELVITLYPRENCTWDEQEKDSILFLMNMMATGFDRARMRELLERVKFLDIMTGIYNTEGFIAAGNQLIGEGRGTEYTAFYFNLTNFKYVNKAVAYQDGNKVMILYVNKLRKFIKPEDIIGRLGGDNFVALIKNERADDFLHFVSNVSIAMNSNGEMHDFVFGATSGVYHLDIDAMNMGKVMMCISTAYQVAREILHQPYAVFSPDMLNQLLHGKEILMKFSAALANYEFMIYYQPKVNLSNNRLEGAEALARWKCGSEVILPGEFIPALEKNGDVCRLDYYIFESLCRDMKRWKEEGRELPVVSSNFSRWHLKNRNFVNDIIAIADKYGIEHKYLEVEVTETTNIEDFTALLQIIRQIKSSGMQVSIDDFGTGYSSLNMLKEIHVDVLKMDKSLLDQSTSPDKLHMSDKIMLKHIVSLAEDMSISVLAEGVENIEQREFLKSIGCKYVQGFLYDRPLALDDFEKRLDYRDYSV